MRRVLVLIALTTFTVCAIAQDANTIWPQPGALTEGTKILINTFTDTNTSYPCEVHTVYATHIACLGHNGAPDTSFDRAAIFTIYLAPHKRPRISTWLIIAGSACLLLAYLIAIYKTDNHGGAANGDLAQTGLAVLIGGGITRFFDGNTSPRMQYPIYIAPHPTPLEP